MYLKTDMFRHPDYIHKEVTPPEPATVTLPVEAPKHATLVCEVMLPDNVAAGCVIVTGTSKVQRLISCTVTV